MKGFVSTVIAMGAACALNYTAFAAEQRQPFPPIELLDAKGGAQTLKSTLGRATILNFWATWCGPCRLELPELQSLYNELGGRGVVVLAVNVDSPRDQVVPFLTRNRITLPVFFLEEETEATLGIRSLPTTVLLDAEGNVVNGWGGYSQQGVADWRQQAESLLAGTRGREGK